MEKLIKEIETDLRKIYNDFNVTKMDFLKEVVEPLLPKENAGMGEFPLIPSHVIISLIELAYAVQLAYYYDWNVDEKFAKRDC